MNVLTPVKPKPTISAEESARRQEGLDYARASVRLEGFVLPPGTEELYARYVRGELSRPELNAAIDALYP